MTYDLRIDEDALKFLKSLDEKSRRIVKENARNLEEEPYPSPQASTELKYWRTKSRAEVDFIKENSDINAYEIKTTPKTTRSMRSFQEIPEEREVERELESGEGSEVSESC